MATSTTSPPFQQHDVIARTTRCIAQTLRSGKDVAVMLVSLTGIERVCASVGHLEAAKLVDELHDGFSDICRDDDAIQRLSDRKFAVLLTGLKNRGHVTLAARKIERIAQAVSERSISDIQVKAIIGVALGPEHGNQAHDLLRIAEIACLEAGRRNDSLYFYEHRAANQLCDEWDLESRLKNALDAGDLELYFQPKILIESGEIVAAEALSRWHDPEIGPVSPELFIDVAESTGQIVPITQFAIQAACRTLSKWRERLPELALAINIPPSLIKNRDIIEMLRSATRIWGVAAERLTLEITETALMNDLDVSHEVLAAIRNFGCKVSIDDFGTGYSSLAYLKEIPADELKIDRTFVTGMLDDPRDHKIVEHAINIAKSFELSAVAEGIESVEALAAVRQLGCDYGQGYYFSKPLPADEFLKFCRDYRA